MADSASQLTLCSEQIGCSGVLPDRAREQQPAPIASPFRFLICGAGLVLVLSAELLFLTVRFDTRTIGPTANLWGRFFSFAPQFAQLAIVVATTVCWNARSRLRSYARQFAEQASLRNSGWRWCGLQGLAYILLVLVSHLLYERGVLSSSAGGWWGAIWAALVISTFMTWLLAVAPGSCWRNFVRAESFSLLLGGAIGIGSLALGQPAQYLWEPLGDLTLWIVVQLLQCFVSDVVVDPATRVVGTDVFRVRIAPQCSGYEGVGLILVFLAAFFTLCRDRLRFPQAWLLWPVGVLAIWLCNSLRIALLIVIGSEVSPEIALGGFHSQAGWIFFNLVALVLATVSLQIPFFTRQSDRTESAGCGSPVVGYLGPFLTLMAANILAAAFSSGFDCWYPAKVLVTLLALRLCRPVRSQHLQAAGTVPAHLMNELIACWPAILNGVVVFALWVAMALPDVQRAGMPEDLLGLSPWALSIWVLFRVVGSVITVPIVEEFAFRGYLMRRFVSDRFEEIAYRAAPWWSVLASSLLFGLMHQRWVAGTIAGLAYALAARRRERLSDAIVAHATTNGLIAALVIWGDAWWLW